MVVKGRAIGRNADNQSIKCEVGVVGERLEGSGGVCSQQAFDEVLSSLAVILVVWLSF